MNLVAAHFLVTVVSQKGLKERYQDLLDKLKKRTKKNVFSWGCNYSNELGDGSKNEQYTPLLISSLENKFIIKLITGGYHTFALSSIFNI